MLRRNSIVLLIVFLMSLFVFHSAEAETPDDGFKMAQIFPIDAGHSYMMNADGSQPARLTNHPMHDFVPAWAPDGKQIAFASMRDGERAEIYLMNADGSSPRRLTQTTTNETAPAWSPDGRQMERGSKKFRESSIS